MFRPDKPKFGGLKETGVDVWAAWTGGKPLPDWTALVATDLPSIDPNQHRSNSVSGSAKSKHHRTMGLNSKFARESDIHVFQKDVWDHLTEHGMDAITHMDDPFDLGSEVASVAFNHARFDCRDGVRVSNNMMSDGIFPFFLWNSKEGSIVYKIVVLYYPSCFAFVSPLEYNVTNCKQDSTVTIGSLISSKALDCEDFFILYLFLVGLYEIVEPFSIALCCFLQRRVFFTKILTYKN